MAETKPDTQEITDREADARIEEGRLARWVRERWDEAEQAARQEGEKESWDDWFTEYWGASPPDSWPSYRQPVTTTEMRDLILREAQEITDTKPRVHVTADNLPPQLLRTAEKLLQAKWADCDVNGELRNALIWSRILPCGWLGIYWDPFLKDGLGDICVYAEDPRYVLPAPSAMNDVTWPYVVKEDWMDLFQVKMRWPDHAARVRPENPPAAAGKSEPKTRSSPYLGPMFSEPGTTQKATSDIPQCRVLTIWVRDPATKEILEERRNPQGEIEAVRSRYVMAYPRGRMIQIASGDVVLTDVPWRISSFPLFRVVAIPPTGGFWPSPFVRDMLPVQQSVDKSWEQLVENMDRCNHGIWFGEGECGLDPDNFSPMPGMTVKGEAGSKLQMIAPPPFPSSMLEAPERLASIMRRKAGMSEARAGTVKGANIGQGLIETEIAQAETPTRLAASLLYQTLRRVAQHMLETLALMYRTSRSVPHFDAGQFAPVQWNPVDENTALRMTAQLDPGSFQPRSETLEKGLILRAAAQGLVGPEYTLKHLGLPDQDEAMQERKTQLFALWQQLMQKGKKKR